MALRTAVAGLVSWRWAMSCQTIRTKLDDGGTSRPSSLGTWPAMMVKARPVSMRSR